MKRRYVNVRNRRQVELCSYGPLANINLGDGREVGNSREGIIEIVSDEEPDSQGVL